MIFFLPHIMQPQSVQYVRLSIISFSQDELVSLGRGAKTRDCFTSKITPRGGGLHRNKYCKPAVISAKVKRSLRDRATFEYGSDDR